MRGEKKHNKFNLIHHVPPLPWHMSITQSCQMGPSAVQYKIHVSGSKIDLRQLMHPFKLLIYLQVPRHHYSAKRHRLLREKTFIRALDNKAISYTMPHQPTLPCYTCVTTNVGQVS